MKQFITIIMVFCGFSLFGQESNPVAEKIAEHHRNNDKFQVFQLFSRQNSPQKSAHYQSMAEDAIVLNLDSGELQRLMGQKPKTIEISFPYKENELTVELFKKKILTRGFEAFDQNKIPIPYEPGIYYRGIVKGDPGSIVAFSFFKNEVVGVASALGIGNVVVGRAKNSNDYLSYTDYTLTAANPFHCGVESLPENQGRQISYDQEMGQNRDATQNCVRIYYEIAYQPYVNNGQNTMQTLNWMTAVHNNIATLYANDGIQISLSSTMIWTTPDPYVYDFSGNLNLFRNTRLAFNGDLGHLVNSPSTTSVAYLNSLCGQYRYAYSGISQYFEEVPVYSWTIMAMTHEMGHAMGSPHTHACAWNGDNTAIDGCGPEAGYDEGCDAPLPTSGGTIMSYCHLVPGVGINLANGFGPQPSALIQSTIESKACLGTDCITSCTANIAGLDFTGVTTTAATINIIDNISDSWEYKIFPYGGGSNTWIPTDSNSFTISGLDANSYYTVVVGNVCDSGSFGSVFEQVLLTDGDYCNGDKFTDTGGVFWDYGDEEIVIKTFYPDNNGTLTLNFSEFDLEQDYDFMTVYDGESTDAPIFENGENLTGGEIPGPFTSTSPSGAITVKFTSDQYMTGEGWEATFVCNLGIGDFKYESAILVYPNPTSSLVNIESKSPIKSVEVYNMMGQRVLTKENLNTLHKRFRIDRLSDGVYFVRVESGNNSQIVQIIKE